MFKNVANTPAGIAKLGIMAYGLLSKQECEYLRAFADTMEKKDNLANDVWQRACDIHDMLRVRPFYYSHYSIEKDFMFECR